MNDKRLWGLATKCLEVEDGDRGRAERLLHDSLDSDTELCAQFVKPLVRLAVSNLIRKVARAHSNVAWNKGQETLKIAMHDGAVGLQQVAVAEAQSLLDRYSMAMTGKWLGDANRDDLALEIAMHDENVKGNQAKAKWFTAIRHELKGAQTVRDRFDEGMVEVLKERSEEIAAG